MTIYATKNAPGDGVIDQLEQWKHELERMDDPTADSHYTMAEHGRLRILIAMAPGGAAWLAEHDRQYAEWVSELDAAEEALAAGE